MIYRLYSQGQGAPARPTPGAFERAAGGTLFFDELQLWSRDKQAALLAALEERRFTRVGGRRDLPVTCRLLFATTVPLDELVREGRLLPDLFFRIGEFIMVLPALAARRADIAVLAHYFLERARERLHPRRFRRPAARRRGATLRGVKLLLDTQVWLWMLAAPDRLAPATRRRLVSMDNELFLSAASGWEIAIKYALGNLPLPGKPTDLVPEWMTRTGVTPLPVLHRHGCTWRHYRRITVTRSTGCSSPRRRSRT